MLAVFNGAGQGRESSEEPLELVRRGGRAVLLAVAALGAYALAEQATPVNVPRVSLVTSVADSGPGSLRQAILDANAAQGPSTISFDSETGPFGTPQTIVLESELPELAGDLTLDGHIKDRLWQATGVTLSGAGRLPALRVGAGAKVTLRALTIAGGRAEVGGGLSNEGNLVIEGVTFLGNAAARDGGALANLGGTVTVINTTFARNEAGASGGGFANWAGKATLTNCTFSENGAEVGGALFSRSALLLRNSILANSLAAADCTSVGSWDPASTHNLIESNQGCGSPISTENPRLAALGYYNGPTQTFPPGGGSPALNRGDNASAVDENGLRLVWDQRGNGDPRFVGGITDIGAFEAQYLPRLVVNTVADRDVRGCARGTEDCSLRGAVALANARGEASLITFDPGFFAVARIVRLERPLPPPTAALVLDASGTDGISLKGDPATIQALAGSGIALRGIELVTEGEEDLK